MFLVGSQEEDEIGMECDIARGVSGGNEKSVGNHTIVYFYYMPTRNLIHFINLLRI